MPTIVAEGIAAGAGTSCAWGATETWCWGNNSSGQIDGSGNTPLAPTFVGSQTERRRDVCVAPTYVCQLMRDGLRLDCTGTAPWITGDGSLDLEMTTAGAQADPATAIACGTGHICVLTESERMYCWGDNARLQTGGPGATVLPPTPTTEPLPPTTVQQIALGESHTCFVGTLPSANRATYCFGARAGFEANQNTQVALTQALESVWAEARLLAVRANNTCVALGAAGSLDCRGIGAPDAGNTPPTASPIGVSAGALRFACAIHSNAQSALCEGNTNATNALGVDSSMTTATHTFGCRLSQIRSGGEHTCALTDLGQVLCWGRNDFRQLGVASLPWSGPRLVTPP